MSDGARVPMIIGVGASAGGLEAFRRLLGAMPPTAGSVVGSAALVYVQHRDTGHPALLTELLTAATSSRVVEVTEPTKIKPGVVYVCPPRTDLAYRDGSLIPTGQIPGGSTPTSPPSTSPTAGQRARGIDHFLYSLAEHAGERAIGVVLSGTGSDGTLGLKAISDAGGITFAQSPETAKHDSMPRNAAATGVVDRVLAPEAIAKEIGEHAAHRVNAGRHRASKTGTPGDSAARIGEAIGEIASILLDSTGHDFKHYKPATLTRRVQRRMQLMRIGEVARYTELLRTDSAERHALFRELLIGVTAFFRDPEAFETIGREVIPRLLRERGEDEPLRVWCAGCAYGAEAYSLAILCREATEAAGTRSEVKIFATDIDERALRIAREGVYPAGIADHVSPERLKRFFTTEGSRYRVTDELRDTVLFSAHNLISDPPFSRQDLISCRNLLIYLGPHLQKKLIPVFHYALRPGGHLFLGPSENIDSHGDLFTPVNGPHRVSRRKGTAVRGVPALRLLGGGTRAIEALASSGEPPPDPMADLTAIAQRIVLDEFAPKYVIIDDSGQIKNTSADVSPYLRIAAGDYRNDIVSMAAMGLKAGLRAAIAEARSTRRRVEHENVSVKLDGKTQRVRLSVQPMPQVGEDDQLLMVVFHDDGLPTSRPDGSAAPGARDENSPDKLIARLETELETTRRDLDRSLQDMDAANQELKSSNEELLSINEELQSANEELETSKEEIRASNEQIGRANADLENLLLSTRIATVFLDDELLIRSYTPAIRDIYELIETDVGRPLSNFVPRTREMPPLPNPTELDADEPVEHTVTSDDGRAFIRRVLPYRTRGGASDGVVVTFTDVTELRTSQQSLLDAMNRLELALDASKAAAWSWDPKTNQPVVGDSMKQLFGFDPSESPTHDEFVARFHDDDRERVLDANQRAMERGEGYEAEYRVRLPSGETRWIHAVGRGEVDTAGRTTNFYGVAHDITDQKTRELDTADREAHLRRVIDNMLNFVGVLTPDGRLVEVNQTSLDIAGITREDVIGKPFWEAHWWSFSKESIERLRDAIDRVNQGETVRFDSPVRTKDNGRIWIDFQLVPVKDDEGNIVFLIPSGVDVTDRHRQEKALARAIAQFELTLETSGAAIWNWDAKTNQPTLTKSLKRIFGFGPSEAPSLEEFFDRIDAADRERVAAAVEKSLHEGGPYIEEYRVNLPDGSVRWIRAVGESVLRDDGGLDDFFGVLVDITDAKTREAEAADRERYLRRVIDNQVGLVGLIDKRGVLLDVDARWLAIAGLSREDVLGKPFAECAWWTYNDEIAATMRDSVERALAGETVRYDVQLFAAGIDRPDQRLWIEFMLAPVFDDDGNVEHVISSGSEIQERKTAEAELRRTEERIKIAAEAAGFGTFHVDRLAGTVTWTNEIKRLLGLSPDDPVRPAPGDVPEFVHPDDRELVREFIDRVFNTPDEPDHTVLHRIVRPDGELRYMQMISRSRVEDVDGRREVVGATGAILDVTERVQQAEALSRERETAEAANRAKSSFFANMSHEIRTPMTAILGHTDLLLNHLRDPDNRFAAATIRRNGEHLLEIVNDILDLSRIEADKLELDLGPVSTVELLGDIQSLMSVRASEKNIALEVVGETKLPREIIADEMRLKQILINLVGNAVKFTETGGVSLRAALIEQQTETGERPSIRFEVQDTGIGMPKHMIGELFEPFSQGDVSRTRRFGGSGLGLAISRRLAEVMGATIAAESVEHEGSTFTLTLPVPDADTGNLIGYDPAALKIEMEGPAGPVRLTGRYLLVDDRRDIRILIQQMIEDAGATAVLASNGREAIETYERLTGEGVAIDAIVMDMQMPVMDGKTAVAELRGLGCTVPIVSLTADAMRQDRQRYLDVGCDDYLAKPVDSRTLVACLDQLTAARWMQTPICVVVDDHPDAARATAALLKINDIKTVEIHTGTEAVAGILEDGVTAAVVDITLPDISGLEVARRVRERGFMGTLVALSGHSGAENRKKALEAGFDHYMVKPGDLPKLLELVTGTGTGEKQNARLDPERGADDDRD
ncbi:MAG: PAS domain S-box protein [Planctomycetota bacterium]